MAGDEGGTGKGLAASIPAGLTALLGAVTAAVGLVVTATGQFSSVVRDNRFWMLAVFGLIFVGLLTLIGSQWLQRRGEASVAEWGETQKQKLDDAALSRQEYDSKVAALVRDVEKNKRRVNRTADLFSLVSVLLAVLGVILLGVIVVTSSDPRVRPRVAAKLTYAEDGTLVLEATAKARGLGSSDVLAFEAYGVTIRSQRNATDAKTKFPTIFESHTGPDRDGTVDLVLSTPVRSLGYDSIFVGGRIGDTRASCNPGTSDDDVPPGCVQLYLPSTPPIPRLSASAQSSSGEVVITGKVKDVPNSAHSGVHVRIFGVLADGTPVDIFSHPYHAGPAGIVDTEFSVPANHPGLRRVCVHAVRYQDAGPPNDAALTLNQECRPSDVRRTAFAALELPNQFASQAKWTPATKH